MKSRDVIKRGRSGWPWLLADAARCLMRCFTLDAQCSMLNAQCSSGPSTPANRVWLRQVQCASVSTNRKSFETRAEVWTPIAQRKECYQSVIGGVCRLPFDFPGLLPFQTPLPMMIPTRSSQHLYSTHGILSLFPHAAGPKGPRIPNTVIASQAQMPVRRCCRTVDSHISLSWHHNDLQPAHEVDKMDVCSVWCVLDAQAASGASSQGISLQTLLYNPCPARCRACASGVHCPERKKKVYHLRSTRAQ
jgi:hypothetical protein